jgi:plastocyanin
MNLFQALAFSSLVAGALVACSSSETTADGGASDASVSVDSSSPTSDAGLDSALPTSDAAVDAPSPTPVKCTQAEFDDTSGGDGGDFTKFPGVDVSFFDAAPKQYVNHCAKTKVGDTVTFAGDFTIHPLVPLGGDTPSFIKATSTGSTAQFVPTTPGTYGFACSSHPSIMFGAIQVVAK